MRVTFVLPNDGMSGGVRVVTIYADRLQRRGHDVTVISVVPPKGRESPRAWLKRLLGRAPKPKMSPQESPYFRNALFRHLILQGLGPGHRDAVPDADVVIATWWETAEWVHALPAGKGRHVHFVQHHEIFAPADVARVRAVYRLPLRRVTISRWLVDVMAEEYGDRNVDCIFNSVDTAQFHAPPRGRQPVPTVGLLHSKTPFKGVEVSLKAIELARRSVPDLKVVSFGVREPRPPLELPAGSVFHQDPDQDRLRDIYASCDVWLCGSHAEGFHLCPSEAMACRTPVVSTRVGGPMDIVREGVNGHLVGIGDHVALADRLVGVLRLPDADWRAMSDAALATVRGYSWDDATDLFEAALLRISRE